MYVQHAVKRDITDSEMCNILPMFAIEKGVSTPVWLPAKLVPLEN